MIKEILIIDDSALMRRVISDIINSDSRFNVAGFAIDGLEALNLLMDNPDKYDAILLDINMPKMNGLELLENLQNNNINNKIIIVSTAAVEGAKETIKALELGAFDFVKKPESFIDVRSDYFKNQVIKALIIATDMNMDDEYDYGTIDINQPEEETRIKPELKDIVKPKTIETNQPVEKDNFTKSTYKKVAKSHKNKLIAIACSTGGPKALHSIVPKIPKDIDASVLIVQHMPEGFTKSLSERLNDLSGADVKEASHGDVLKKGVVYIAKGGTHLTVNKKGPNHRLYVKAGTPVRGLMPCADLMYESLKDCDYDEIICVVLTGMGSDGTEGIKELNKSKDIYVIAQDEETSVVYGMPRSIYKAGIVDEKLPLDKIVESIINKMGVN
ncbi:MAG TPA: chemotaxis-specific protein-glutamate methyltransferase CheB [Clostridiales bacterium]|nr:chemotaxis-specific protein-glutamate methyltransferase CheB [Clostridiales bacterium]